MKVRLVKVTERDEYYNEEEDVRKFDSEATALDFVGSVAKGDFDHVLVNAVYSVNLNYAPPEVKSLELVLENFKMVLREKK